MAMFTKNKDKEEEIEDGAAVEDGDAPVDEVEEVTDEAETAGAEAPAEEAADAEAENADDDEDDDDDDDNSGGGDELDLDLMDIFEAEQNETTSTAGIYSEFLENLTMEEVLDQANMLLDEIRAKLGR